MDRTKINQWIMDGWLYRASRLLYVELENAPFIEGKSTLKSSLDTYQRMMQFLEQGAKDEQRDEVLNFLKLKMLQVSDTIYRQRRKQNSSEQYYTTLRIIESQGMPEAFYTRGLESEPQDLSSEERFAYDNRLSTLFEYLWVSERLSQEMADILAGMSEYARQMMVASLTLGLLYQWDIQKVRFIIQELTRPEISIRYQVRLFFALILVSYIHPKRSMLYAKELKPLLAAANEVHSFDKLFSAQVDAFLLSSDTERVTQIVEKNLPEIIRANQKNNNLGATLFELDSDDTGPIDPELKALEERVKELGKLEEEGADTLYVAFRNFKRLPFFNTIASWFTPFDPQHSAVKELYESNEVIQKLMPYFSQKLCDSDLFSAILSLPNRIQPLNLQDPNLAAMLDQMKEPVVEVKQDNLQLETRRYVQDFYRFVNLFSGQSLGSNIFDKLPIRSFPLLTFGNYTVTYNRQTALFYMSRGRYQAAIPLLQKIVQENPADATSLGRLGYILYKEGNYQEAISCLEKSDLVEDLSQHLRVILAHSYRKMGFHDKALAIYNQYRKEPSMLLAMAATYIVSGSYEEAIPLLHEYIYRSSTPQRAYRSLAWSYFMVGDYTKSEEYHDKIEKPNANDFLNKLYLYIAQDDLVKAFQASLQLVEVSEIETISKGIENDLPKLNKPEITKDILTLLLDSALFAKQLKEEEKKESETNQEN